jgi:RNA polymerase primary sigma factor
MKSCSRAKSKRAAIRSSLAGYPPAVDALLARHGAASATDAAGDEDDDTPNDESRARASARRDALRDALATLRGALHAQGCRSAEYRDARNRVAALLGELGWAVPAVDDASRVVDALARAPANAAGDAGTDAACFDAPARRALGAARCATASRNWATARARCWKRTCGSCCRSRAST